MDLTQSKLSKKEWASVEIPVAEREKSILRLIHDGYSDINIRYNTHPSILVVMKIEPTPDIETYIFIKYFQQECLNIVSSLRLTEFVPIVSAKAHQPKKVDLLRLQHMEIITGKQRDGIFEYKLLEMCKGCVKEPAFHMYTLICLLRANIQHLNKPVLAFAKRVIKHVYDTQPDIVDTIFNDAYRIIEKNPNVLMYEDMKLYDHQKHLFSLFNREENEAKLVLYSAPTGTGKTLSPLGLSRGFRIIYICAARHVGLALAKAAISMEKCVAFAFGCETASDIRLHYYAAVDYTKNTKTGGIFKVDNTNGIKVEIMICDIASYLVAMYYMLNFNPEETLILYWDEPTISLDVPSHPLHPLIQNVWRENKLSKIILSCATLPKDTSILPFLEDYKEKFDGGKIHNVSSTDCKKTISLLDPQGKIVLPHSLFANYSDIESCLMNCEENGALLRYMDLREIILFVQFIMSSSSPILRSEYHPRNYFENSVEGVTMQGIKCYYLKCLKWIGAEHWSRIQEFMSTSFSQTRTHSGILLTTADAHTLTDGPTIFIAEDVDKIGKFCIQQSKIPAATFESLMSKIVSNEKIQSKMEVLMKALDDTLGTDADKEKKSEKETFKPEAKKLMAQIEAIRSSMVMVAMDPTFLPNTRQHQAVWIKDKDKIVVNAFVPFIDELTVKEIMETDVDVQMKLLLLLGIGVFATNVNSTYMEIMKRLSTEQRLYLIIASSDYIYGTNYQLCHAFLGKDLNNMTQQKIIQALGRVGRGNSQQDYTVRFRDASLLARLFLKSDDAQNLEAIHMNEWVNSV